MDHDWPSELDIDARCERCGLSYTAWSTDELNCVPPGSPAMQVPPRYKVEPEMQTVVLVCFDRGAEWEETLVYGPFASQADAEAFAAQAERAQQEDPDCTVTAWGSTLQKVHAIEKENINAQPQP
jgi:hypothetical protein